MFKSARGLFTKLTALILVVLGCRGYPQMMASFGSGGTVTVATGSQIPAIPANAVTFANLQDPSVSNPGSWTICNANNSCAAGTPSGTGSASLTPNTSSPSLSTNGSLKFINTTLAGSTTGWNTLVYRHLGAGPFTRNDSSGTLALGSITNAILDEWIYLAPYTGTVGPEWDPDIFLNSTETTKASIACYASSGGLWDLYDQSKNAPTGGGWTPTSLACPFNTTGAGQWHHIRLWITFNQGTNKYTYQELDVDGTPVFSPTNPPNISPTFNSLAINQGNELNVEFQLDNGSTTGTTTEYLDEINFTVW